MTIQKIEAIVDALSALHEYHRPDSEAYKLRNPILLKSFAKPGKHNVTEDGLRVFDSHLGGYKAACFDIALKLRGDSNCGLTSADKLKNLLAVLRVNQEQDQMVVVFFLRKALSDKDISLTTPLEFFKD